MRALVRALVPAVLGGVAIFACATIGSPPGGMTGLPSANLGPFRELNSAEDPTYPNVFQRSVSVSEPSVIAADPTNPSSMGVYLYVVSQVPSATDAGTSTVIVRTHADDGRTFYGSGLDPELSKHEPPVVLPATLPWEGSSVTGPSALRVGPEFNLYYAAAGGIGLAQSADGIHFTKYGDGPVLPTASGSSWETTPPFAPSVAQLPDGSFDMMYAAGVSIGEATSLDGIHFARVDGDPTTPELDPVLSPLGTSGSVPDGAVPPIDTERVSDPCIVPVTSPGGRLVVRVLYTGYGTADDGGTRPSAIGFAGRFGASGKLVRQPLPVFTLTKPSTEPASAPAYFAWDTGAMVYVTAQPSIFGIPESSTIAAGFAPAQEMLPPPGTFPNSP